MSRDKPNAEVDLPWSQPKEDFYQMCLNKSLLLFLTCVKGKIYFAPKRKILSCLLNSPVNQEKPETSALWPLAFILFAKLKGGLSFLGACACAKQQDQCQTWAIQCKGTLRRQAAYRGPEVGGMPRSLSPRAGCSSWHWVHPTAIAAYGPTDSSRATPIPTSQRLNLAQQQISKYFDIK